MLAHPLFLQVLRAISDTKLFCCFSSGGNSLTSRLAALSFGGGDKKEHKRNFSLPSRSSGEIDYTEMAKKRWDLGCVNMSSQSEEALMEDHATK